MQPADHDSHGERPAASVSLVRPGKQEVTVQIVFDCPRCLQRSSSRVNPPDAAVTCSHCEWSRPIGAAECPDGTPRACLVCGCHDLWRQKDFPPALGVALVGLGVILSTLAVAWMRPILAMAILMAFALADMLLFLVMKDCVVCYRCHSRTRGTGPLQDHAKFDLELNERYRQEAIRAESATRTS